MCKTLHVCKMYIAPCKIILRQLKGPYSLSKHIALYCMKMCRWDNIVWSEDAQRFSFSTTCTHVYWFKWLCTLRVATVGSLDIFRMLDYLTIRQHSNRFVLENISSSQRTLHGLRVTWNQWQKSIDSWGWDSLRGTDNKHSTLMTAA